MSTTGPPARRLLLLGKQGAGKGTAGASLADRLDIPHVSTGDIFREAVASATPLGRIVERYLDAGELVPDDVVVEVVADRLCAPDAADGYVLDGFPRSAAQAHALDNATEASIDLAVLLDIDTDVALDRIRSRRVCARGHTTSAPTPDTPSVPCPRCDRRATPRHDDTPESLRRRLSIYENQTAPIIAHYRADGRLVVIDASQPADAVLDEVLERTAQATAHPIAS